VEPAELGENYISNPTPEELTKRKST